MGLTAFLFSEGRLRKTHIAPHYLQVQASFLLKVSALTVGETRGISRRPARQDY
jgi:hypothetical protein